MNPTFAQLCKNPIHLLAFGFGSGLAARAPGTFGSVAASAIAVFLLQLPVVLYWCITLAVVLSGIYICGKTARDLKTHDHGGIVWDEFAGIFITLLPIGSSAHFTPHQADFWWMLAAALVLFRIFDILKPIPIGIIDRKVSGGLGIMLDDIIAAVYSLICLHILLSVFF